MWNMEQWMSVEECPPPINELVKTINKKGIIAICKYCGDNRWYLQLHENVGGMISFSRNYPTHWMPLIGK